MIKQGIKDARENKRGKLSMHFLERAKYLQDSADRMWAFFGKVRRDGERARARESEGRERKGTHPFVVSSVCVFSSARGCSV